MKTIIIGFCNHFNMVDINEGLLAMYRVLLIRAHIYGGYRWEVLPPQKGSTLTHPRPPPVTASLPAALLQIPG